VYIHYSIEIKIIQNFILIKYYNKDEDEFLSYEDIDSVSVHPLHPALMLILTFVIEHYKV